jgi:aminoglycoside phosphotransferase (APT) family kinase protein
MIEALLAQEGLRAEEVHRSGPRYWVGRVRSESRGPLMLKAVVDDQPWVDPETGTEFRPSDQLRAEADVLETLGRLQGEVAGTVPRVIARDGGNWVLRTLVQGRTLGGPSSLRAEPALFGKEVTRAIIDFVMSLQALTPEIREMLSETAGTHKSKLKNGTVWYDLHHPAEPLVPYAEGLIQMASNLEDLHDARARTFVHGEMYPGHIILDGGKVGLIDWENAGLGSQFSDFAALWWRGFARPGWQDELLAQLEARGLLRTPEDRALWSLETSLQAAGNLTYLHWSELEPPEVKGKADLAFRRHIEEALA